MKNLMGIFYTSCRVGNRFDRNKTIEVSKVLVDTGAEFSCIKADTLKKAGVNQENRSYRFVTTTGQEITRPIGFAVIHVGDAMTTDEVVFGEPGDLEILGARTLEGMNLRVDPRQKKLVAGGPILAA